MSKRPRPLYGSGRSKSLGCHTWLVWKFKIVLFKILGAGPSGSLCHTQFFINMSAPRIKDSAPLGIQEKRKAQEIWTYRFKHRG